jgi:hypothetical protein
MELFLICYHYYDYIKVLSLLSGQYSRLRVGDQQGNNLVAADVCTSKCTRTFGTICETEYFCVCSPRVIALSCTYLEAMVFFLFSTGLAFV